MIIKQFYTALQIYQPMSIYLPNPFKGVSSWCNG